MTNEAWNFARHSRKGRTSNDPRRRCARRAKAGEIRRADGVTLEPGLARYTDFIDMPLPAFSDVGDHRPLSGSLPNQRSPHDGAGGQG
ncbi:hypothetical protein ACRAWD_13710 [Caulobacter segnis]